MCERVCSQVRDTIGCCHSRERGNTSVFRSLSVWSEGVSWPHSTPPQDETWTTASCQLPLKAPKERMWRKKLISLEEEQSPVCLQTIMPLSSESPLTAHPTSDQRRNILCFSVELVHLLVPKLCLMSLSVTHTCVSHPSTQNMNLRTRSFDNQLGLPCWVPQCHRFRAVRCCCRI